MSSNPAVSTSVIVSVHTEHLSFAITGLLLLSTLKLVQTAS